MPRSKSKVGMSSTGGQKPIVITDRDWERIESNYGHPIPRDLRDKIQQSTQAFASSAICEVRAADVVDARKATKTLLSSGKAFQRAITEPTEMDGRFYAFHLVRNYIRDDRLGDYFALHSQDPVKALSGVLTSFEVACEKALAELSDPNRAEIMVGEAWEEWIHQLTAILDESGLPTAARKDSDKQKGSTPSSFVAFVRELQECVPTACWRRRSDSALATAIGSAR